jgi:hypothetical protein
MERYGDILGQNPKILMKNRQILEKMYNYFIFTSILNPHESFHDEYHRLSFLMSQARFVCSTGHFGAKTADLKLLPVNSILFESLTIPVGP